MDAETLGRAIEATALGRAVRETPLAWPLLESVHIFGIALLLGAAVAMDLGLLGWRRGTSAGALAETLTPLALVGLGLAAVSGAAMGAAAASTVLRSDAAPWKAALIALALGNAALWRRALHRAEAGGNAPSAAHARAAAILSLLGWTGALIAGRMLAYF